MRTKDAHYLYIQQLRMPHLTSHPPSFTMWNSMALMIRQETRLRYYIRDLDHLNCPPQFCLQVETLLHRIILTFPYFLKISTVSHQFQGF